MAKRNDESKNEKKATHNRFSYISVPIGVFGAQINQPLVLHVHTCSAASK
jgi:hypothetical protein